MVRITRGLSMRRITRRGGNKVDNEDNQWDDEEDYKHFFALYTELLFWRSCYCWRTSCCCFYLSYYPNFTFSIHMLP